MTIKTASIDNLTNQITYNRLLRNTHNILNNNLFEQNDEFTRKKIITELNSLYRQAKTNAISDYIMTVREFDKTKPHYIEVDISIRFKNMINHVILNISNTDSL